MYAYICMNTLCDFDDLQKDRESQYCIKMDKYVTIQAKLPQILKKLLMDRASSRKGNVRNDVLYPQFG